MSTNYKSDTEAIEAFVAKHKELTAEIGKVMGVASKELSGKADGKKIAELAKTLLS